MRSTMQVRRRRTPSNATTNNARPRGWQQAALSLPLACVMRLAPPVVRRATPASNLPKRQREKALRATERFAGGGAGLVFARQSQIPARALGCARAPAGSPRQAAGTARAPSRAPAGSPRQAAGTARAPSWAPAGSPRQATGTARWEAPSWSLYQEPGFANPRPEGAGNAVRPVGAGVGRIARCTSHVSTGCFDTSSRLDHRIAEPPPGASRSAGGIWHRDRIRSLVRLLPKPLLTLIQSGSSTTAERLERPCRPLRGQEVLWALHEPPPPGV
jgi:hypothetical protein